MQRHWNSARQEFQRPAEQARPAAPADARPWPPSPPAQAPHARAAPPAAIARSLPPGGTLAAWKAGSSPCACGWPAAVPAAPSPAPARPPASRLARRADMISASWVARTQLSAHAWPARAAPQAAVRAVRARTLCPTGPPPRASPRASLPTPSRASPRFCRTAGARVSSSTNRNREKKNFLKAPCCWRCRRGQGADSGAMPSDHYGVRGRSRAPPRVPAGCAGAGRAVGSAGRALG